MKAGEIDGNSFVACLRQLKDEVDHATSDTLIATAFLGGATLTLAIPTLVQGVRIKSKWKLSDNETVIEVVGADKTGAHPTLPSRTVHKWRGEGPNTQFWEIYCGDCRDALRIQPADNFHCAVTSPPYYWQRDYGVTGQIGKEKAIHSYVTAVADVMDELNRVLRDDGVLFLNLGDTYYSAKGKPHGNDKKNSARRFGLRAVDASGLGVPRKTAIGIPWRVALEMIGRGWTLRSDIIWVRPGAVPEPTAKDRPWRTYEHIFMFTRSPKYYFNRSGLRGVEDVWEFSARPRRSNVKHSAAFPEELVERCLDVGCPAVGNVIDPFSGSGTVARVAVRRGHSTVGIDLNRVFCLDSIGSLLEL